MKVFNQNELKKLYHPAPDSSGEDNGQITIIGGSELFHGAPLLSLKVASRVVDMVFFSSPDGSLGEIANKIKSELFSFIWVPWDEVGDYIKKSDAVLIGPGMMRYHKEADNGKEHTNLNLDGKGKVTREATEKLLKKFPNKKWVIDGGSLQTMDVDWIPEGAIVTPNRKEFEILFKEKFDETKVLDLAKKYRCTIVHKGPVAVVSDGDEVVQVKGGNAGLTKGGTGDVLAGLTAALLAKNEPLLAASTASYIVKKTADVLHQKVGTFFSADDLANKLPEVFYEEIL